MTKGNSLFKSYVFLLYILLAILIPIDAVEIDKSVDQVDALLGWSTDEFALDENIQLSGAKTSNSHEKTSNHLDFNNSVILEEATPVKDSLNYNSRLLYRFDADISSEYTHSYQVVIYLSGSLCQLPDDVNSSSSDNGLSIFYTFNATKAEAGDLSQLDSMYFQNGFASGIAEAQMISDVSNYTLYMIVVPDECDLCTNDSTWVFEFAVSQQTILFLYDTESRVSVVDLDYDSVIFEAEEFIFDDYRSYKMYLFENQYPLPTGLNQSWCAISETTNYTKLIDLNSTSVTGVSNLFVLSDLKIATTYSGVLVSTFSNIPYGGGIFEPFSFSMSKSKSCKLAYNLEFCDEVAYAVPISSALLYEDETWLEFISAYDNYTESLYQPFEYAMQQIACDTELDARYSPLRTCDDCRYSYKQWLCAVTIPRCVSTLNSQEFNKQYEAGTGRNDFIGSKINPPLPYAEVLPCLNVCQAIVRDCPSDFNFACPEHAELIKLSYGDPRLEESGPFRIYDVKGTTSLNGVSITSMMDGTVETYRVCNYLGEANISNTTYSS